MKLRAGLRVCPERDEGCLKEAHFTAQTLCFMTLVHPRVAMCHVNFCEKNSRESKPSADFVSVGLSRFSFFCPV